MTNAIGILRPLDDVDLLAAQLADDRLHARALHADAGADRIDVALAREDGDLRAVAGFAHGAADHHGAVVDLRHFLLEQLDEQRRIGARQHDLRALGAAVDALDDGAHAVARRVALGARLFLARQHGLDAADLDDDVAVLEALDRAVDDLADALVVLGEDVLALGLADLLEDDLLGRLRGDAAEHLGGLGELDLSDLDFGVRRRTSPALRRARSRVAGFVTSSTIVFTAKRSTWPVSGLNRVFRFSPVL